MMTANTYVYRYLKTGDIKGSISWAEIDCDVTVDHARAADFICAETFDPDPGEKDISFFRSFRGNDTSRILDVLSEMLKRRNGNGFSVNSGMMRIDFEEAHEDLNDIRETVKFIDNDKTKNECRHYGLVINSTSSLDRLETVTALIELSEFYALKQKSKKPDRRDILHFAGRGKFDKIAENTLLL